MLERLTIENLILIEKNQIEFQKGLISITGETGAGKSVLIDAIAYVLGDRASSAVVKEGKDQAVIQADFVFDKDHQSIKTLNEFGIDTEDGEFSIRRKISSDGKSSIFVNGNKVSQAQVRQISAHIVDMHSQYDNQILLNSKNHVELLDSFAGVDVKKLADSYKYYLSKKTEMEDFLEKAENQEKELLLQKSYLEELELLDIKENEIEDLKSERMTLINADKLISNIQKAEEYLSSDLSSRLQSASGLLSEASLSSFGTNQEKLTGYSERLSSIEIELQDVSSDIDYFLNSIEVSPERLEQVDDRLFAIKDVVKKHKVTEEEAHLLKDMIQQEVEKLENFEQNMGNLSVELEKAKNDLIAQANSVAKQRAKHSPKLEKEIEKVLKKLHMEDASFKVNFKDLDFENWNAKGSQQVEFFVSTNLGQGYSELSKVASGGEVARLMLALKVVFFKNVPSQTLVFDEIDTGVGGKVADSVGECIKELSKHHQVIVISHQAQVASKANQHLRIQKDVVDNQTVSSVKQLEPEDIINELARMISGKTITQESKALASKMINY